MSTWCNLDARLSSANSIVVLPLSCVPLRSRVGCKTESVDYVSSASPYLLLLLQDTNFQQLILEIWWDALKTGHNPQSFISLSGEHDLFCLFCLSKLLSGERYYFVALQI